ncbi:hypothetical protein N0V82_005377 [Gnomoniopsis sp. IMI 355080]|nr:hypothetical protein N0V82_005377 [Gnomoniopsis sp. IMI 355080]
MLDGIAACFSCFPRLLGRFQSSTTAPTPPPAADPQAHQNTSGYQRQESPSSSFHDKAQEIAQIPVSGMLRTPGPGQTSSYISSYQPVQSKGPNAAGRNPSQNAGREAQGAANADTDTTDDTLVGSAADSEKKEGGYGHDANKSTWQGKPNGTVYDRRTELTEEDEDMWARLAM